MQIKLTGQNIEITDALRDYVESKFSRLERHYDHGPDHPIGTHVVLGTEKINKKAEATVHIPSEKLHAEAKASDMYAAIDELVDKLDRQIKRHKEKRTNHHPHHSKVQEEQSQMSVGLSGK